MLSFYSKPTEQTLLHLRLKQLETVHYWLEDLLLVELLRRQVVLFESQLEYPVREVCRSKNKLFLEA